MAALAAGSLAVSASSNPGPVAHASKCKKGKKAAKAKKKKKCKKGQQSQSTLPGQATHPTVTPPPGAPTILVNALSVAADPVLGGDSTSGQVTISQAAPSGGRAVALSSDSAHVTVPANVVVPAGQTTAGFTVDSTSGSDLPVTATLTATIAGSNASTSLSVVGTPSVSSVALQKKCFTGPPAPYGSNRVTLDVPAPADTVVDLSSNSGSLTVPSTVTVPSGSRSALFGVTTTSTPGSATVTASLGASSAFATSSVSATSPTPTVAALTLDSDDVTVGTSVQGTVTLDCEALSGGTTVNVQSDLPGVDVQGPVVVPQDQLSTTFTITTSVSGTATITAGSQAAPLQVNELGT